MSLWKALSQLQSTVRTIPHDSKGHGYTYASLDRIWDAIRKPMHEAGLAVSQVVECVEGRAAVRTILAHCESGEKVEGIAVSPPAPANRGMSPVQQMGSDITYLRRYGLASILGLTTDADVDGAWMDDSPSEAPAEAHKPTSQPSLDDVRQWCVGLKGALREAKSVGDFTRHKEDAVAHFGTLPEMVKTTLDTAFKVWQKGQTTMDKESK